MSTEVQLQEPASVAAPSPSPVQRAWEAVCAAALESPWLVAVAVTLVSYLVISPWGEFPLNDDWTFARVAKKFAETGRISVDVPSGPSLVLQSILGAALTKVFGFSHLLMRLLTMSLGVVGLWALDVLLRRANVSPRLRFPVLIAVALNPLYLYLSSTFMTELYGHIPALLGVVIWFRGRSNAEGKDAATSPRVISLPSALGSAALIGFTFWTRQYASFAFPAVWGATMLHLAYQKQWRRMWSAAPALAGSLVLFAAVVLGYFAWAKATGNFRPEFAIPLDELKRIDLGVSRMQLSLVSFYLTAFFFPLLLLFWWKGRRELVVWGALGLALIGLAVMAMQTAERHGMSNLTQSHPQHRVMPFASNVIYNAGIGPITLRDVYYFEFPRPSWALERWKAYTWFLVVAAAAWAPVLIGLWHALRSLKGKLAWETMMHGLLFSVGSFAFTVQASKIYVYDRYYIPIVLGLALMLGTLLQANRDRVDATKPALRWPAFAAFAVALFPATAFTVLGLHDQFQWNEVRWRLVNHALSEGAEVANIDGGYEVNGWLNVDNIHSGHRPARCIGQCWCPGDWYCTDSSYLLAFVRMQGYDIASALQPDYWLAPGPPMLLLRRHGSL